MQLLIQWGWVSLATLASNSYFFPQAFSETVSTPELQTETPKLRTRTPELLRVRAEKRVV